MKEIKPGFFIPNEDEIREKQYLEDFGRFAMEARKSRNLTFRAAAEEIGITAAYLSDIEKGKEKPPTRKVLDAMITVYKLTDVRKKEFNELAARARGTLSLAYVNLFNGFTAAKHIAFMLTEYRNYLENQQGIIDDEVTNKELWKLAHKIDALIYELMPQEEDSEDDDNE